MRTLWGLSTLLPGIFKKFTILPGVMSLVSLYSYYGKHGLDETLLLVLRGYEVFLDFIVGWLKPFIEAAAQAFGWHILLYPHWRHVLVLLGIYFMAGASVEREEHNRGRTSSWKFRLALGLVIAFLTSVLVGVIPVSSSEFWPNFAIALIAFLMVACNDLLLRAYRGWRTLAYETTVRISGTQHTWSQYFWKAGNPILKQTLLSLIASCPIILAVQGVLAPGIVVLMLFVLYLGLFQIYLGVKELRTLCAPTETLIEAASRSRGVLIGVNMLVAFAFALLLITFSVAKELLSQ